MTGDILNPVEQNVSSRRLERFVLWQVACISLGLACLNFGVTSAIAGVLWIIACAAAIICWWIP